ncbi:hypothetical protein NA56DRAFT_652541 [Hyaloscypha hepaticicola]|uniref:Uncharacterized protein n=1 Tax=Hyaloscypha hepaticicola TaxID=2082293 RepID=A0A2J6PEB7_9HELO|nr:hypothetical protein NA56DRAFT_652541 [Hyaloscypha hepaticicola]
MPLITFKASLCLLGLQKTVSVHLYTEIQNKPKPQSKRLTTHNSSPNSLSPLPHSTHLSSELRHSLVPTPSTLLHQNSNFLIIIISSKQS